MTSLPGYDRWKTTPPPEGEPCPDCAGAGYHADEDGRWTCDECDGTGVVDGRDDGEPEREYDDADGS
jgi:DnaJ-class molecular chaperone